MAERKVNLDEAIETASLRRLRSMDAHAVVEWLKERHTWDYNCVPIWKLRMLEKHLAGVRDTHGELLDALREIAKPEGAFSVDQLKHASNTVENMVRIAEGAITKAERGAR